MVRIIRIIAVFVITFLAHRFLSILFDLIRSSFKKQPDDKDKNPEIEIIETEFIEKESEDGDGDEDKDEE